MMRIISVLALLVAAAAGAATPAFAAQKNMLSTSSQAAGNGNNMRDSIGLAKISKTKFMMGNVILPQANDGGMNMPMPGTNDDGMEMPMPSTMPDSSLPNDGYCVVNSTSLNSDCADYSLPDSVIASDIQSLCTAMSYMPGCTVQNLCTSSGPKISTQSYCAGMSVLADVCVADPMMANMGGCSHYKQMCMKGSKVQQCAQNPSLPGIPSTMGAMGLVTSICNEMTMDGCELCPATSSGMPSSSCDVFTVYAQLCQAMPGMYQCANFTVMCNNLQSLGNGYETFPLCFPDATGSPTIKFPPTMLMYFHTGIREYLLFKSIVPETETQYALAWLAIFFVTLLFQLFTGVKTVLCARWAQVIREHEKKVASDEELLLLENKNSLKHKSMIARTLSWVPPIRIYWLDVARGILVFIEATVAYALMLLTMTFNVGYFFAVMAGLSVGSILFGRWRNDASAAASSSSSSTSSFKSESKDSIVVDASEQEAACCNTI